MSDEEIKNKIKMALANVTGEKNLQISDETTLFDDLGLESIDFVDLIFETEQLLDCQLDVNELIRASQSSKGEKYAKITFQQFFDFVKINCLKK